MFFYAVDKGEKFEFFGLRLDWFRLQVGLFLFNDPPFSGSPPPQPLFFLSPKLCYVEWINIENC